MAEVAQKPHVVYRCYDTQGELLYIGCTVNLANRLANHRHSERSARWLPRVARIEQETHPDRDTAREAERLATAAEIGAAVRDGSIWRRVSLGDIAILGDAYADTIAEVA